MFGSNNSLLTEVLLFCSILICITKTSELQPKIEVSQSQPNQTSNNGAQQKETINSKTVTIPLNSQDHKNIIPIPAIPNKEPPATLMEGGGTISTHSPDSNLDATDTEVYESQHTKGSKGRKGVEIKPSSVVPRKGVIINPAPTFEPTTMASSQLVKVSSSIKKVGNTEEQSKIYSKKHKQLSEDPDDDFDKYPWIKSSTTGEDYVIIGIVIIIGIWFSVFGALVFYRRAGEYWDRRHYRRMDFLVEGMYND